jgi:hypothetical protein
MPKRPNFRHYTVVVTRDAAYWIYPDRIRIAPNFGMPITLKGDAFEFVKRHLAEQE